MKNRQLHQQSTTHRPDSKSLPCGQLLIIGAFLYSHAIFTHRRPGQQTAIKSLIEAVVSILELMSFCDTFTDLCCWGSETYLSGLDKKCLRKTPTVLGAMYQTLRKHARLAYVPGCPLAHPDTANSNVTTHRQPRKFL